MSKKQSEKLSTEEEANLGDSEEELNYEYRDHSTGREESNQVNSSKILIEFGDKEIFDNLSANRSRYKHQSIDFQN